MDRNIFLKDLIKYFRDEHSFFYLFYLSEIIIAFTFHEKEECDIILNELSTMISLYLDECIRLLYSYKDKMLNILNEKHSDVNESISKIEVDENKI